MLVIWMFQECGECVMVRTHSVLLLAVALCAATTTDSELGVGKAINIFMRYVSSSGVW